MRTLTCTLRALCRALVIGVLFIGNSVAIAAADPSACNEAAMEFKSQLLASVDRAEAGLRDYQWRQWQTAELLYHPLWQARIEKDGSFATHTIAQGDVHFQRYRHLAEIMREDTAGIQASVLNHLGDLPRQLTGADEICPSFEYAACAGRWREQWRLRVESLTEKTRAFIEHHREWIADVQASVEDSPSEHHGFKFRYQDRVTEWQMSLLPELIQGFRELREYIEFDWLGAACCGRCSPYQIERSQQMDPPLKPDREATRGVEGDALGRHRIDGDTEVVVVSGGEN